MRGLFPAAFAELEQTVDRLEQHYRDVQDIEFTVEQGRLYLLQTRSAKRTAAAAVRAAVAMVGEGLLDRDDAISRIDPAQLDHLLHPMIDGAATFDVVAKGLAASPGAASGRAVFDADTAEARGREGEDVILVRWETSPDDIHGLIAAKGILTAHGGIASHAALVARGMGKPCVAGCAELTIDLESRVATIGGHAVAEGELITARRRHRQRHPRRGRARACDPQRRPRDDPRLGGRRPAAGGARERGHARPTRQRRASSALRGSGSAARSTCSSATSACRSSRR